MSEPRRLDAYYYEFTGTSSLLVDKLLGAVACAGKASHHTADWNDATAPYDDHTGDTPVEWIQNAANELSDHLSLRGAAERAALSARLAEAEKDALIALKALKDLRGSVVRNHGREGGGDAGLETALFNAETVLMAHEGDEESIAALAKQQGTTRHLTPAEQSILAAARRRAGAKVESADD